MKNKPIVRSLTSLAILSILVLSLSLFAVSQTNETEDNLTDDNLTNDNLTDEEDFELGDGDDGEAEVMLNGSQEVPATDSNASGEASVRLDGNVLTVEGSFEDLGSDLMNVSGTPGHIHLGEMDGTGPVVFPLMVESDEDARGGTFTLTETLTTAQRDDLLDGLYYINIHSEQYMSGEIRGQILLDTMVVIPTPTNTTNATNQTGNNTVNNQTVNQTTPTGGNVDLYVKAWYPKNNTVVFVCNTSGYTPSDYTWHYGDGNKLLNIRNDNTFHEFSSTGNFVVNCTANRANGPDLSDTLTFILTGDNFTPECTLASGTSGNGNGSAQTQAGEQNRGNLGIGPGGSVTSSFFGRIMQWFGIDSDDDNTTTTTNGTTGINSTGFGNATGTVNATGNGTA